MLRTSYEIILTPVQNCTCKIRGSHCSIAED